MFDLNAYREHIFINLWLQFISIFSSLHEY
jgi:hypothetical protein